MIANNGIKKREMELYIHIPFCIKKCKYCDFLSAPAEKQVQTAYMEALLEEIRGNSDKAQDCRIISVFIGGGTPSSVDAVWIRRIMDAVREHYTLDEGAEISMEVNPGTVTGEGLLIYRMAGVNRLSIGCQSANDEELERIGRVHNFKQFLDTYECARRTGFDNINVDLMSGLPGQSLKDWENTLGEVLKLSPIPEHISAYSLIVEENTPFYEMYVNGSLSLPGEDEEREMYWRAAQMLKSMGYEHYEISNYALKGYRCRHNCGYWGRRDYLGFGIGAASLYNNERFKNTDSLESYVENPLQCQTERQELTVSDRMAETMFLGLRMSDGVDIREFKDTYGISVEEIYGEQIRESIQEEILTKCGNRLVLTNRGVDISNYVMAKFLI